MTQPTYIFDMDNTLYPYHGDFFKNIENHYFQQVAKLLNLPFEEAKSLANHYHQKYGNSAIGLSTNHNLPMQQLLDDLHSIADHSLLTPCPQTIKMLEELEGRKVVLTNAPEKRICGSHGYAHKTLQALGIHHVFEGVYGVVWSNYIAKPDPRIYQKLLHELQSHPSSCIMIEDTVENLSPAKQLGMQTVLIHPQPPQPQHAAYVDDYHPNIQSYLAKVSPQKHTG